MTKSQLSFMALGAVTNFNHYTLRYFQWLGEYDTAIAAYHVENANIRTTERDPAIRDELYSKSMDRLDDTIIRITDTYYPKDASGNWAEPVEVVPSAPVLAVNNSPEQEQGGDDDGGTVFIAPEPADQPEAEVAVA